MWVGRTRTRNCFSAAAPKPNPTALNSPGNVGTPSKWQRRYLSNLPVRTRTSAPCSSGLGPFFFFFLPFPIPIPLSLRFHLGYSGWHINSHLPSSGALVLSRRPSCLSLTPPPILVPD